MRPWFSATLALSLAAGCVFDPSGISSYDAATAGDLDRVEGGAADLDAAPAADLDAAGDAGADTGDAGDAAVADQGPDTGPPLTTLSVDDGRLWLGIPTAARVALLSWDESALSWTAETNVPLPAGDVYWALSRVFAKAGDLALFKVAVGGKPHLQAFRFSGGGWSQALYLAGGSSTLDKRDVALADEHTSGELLVVYGDGTSRPLYVTYSGAVWSSPASLPINDGSGGSGPDLSSGKVLWVELVVNRMKGSDEIALLMADDNDDLVVLSWDGKAWDTSSGKVLTTNLRDHTSSGILEQRSFDGAFERKSGDLLVAWGDGSNNGFRYGTRPAGGSWSGTSGVSAPSSGKTDFVDLAENPDAASDEIAGAFVDQDGTERLGLGTWDGSKWVGAKEYDSSMRNVNNQAQGDFPAAVGWVGSTGEAVCVYADDEQGTLDWYRWTGGDWQSGSDLSISGKAYTESVLARGYSAHNKLLVVLSDSDAEVYSAVYDGKSFKLVTKPTVLASKLSQSDTLPFSLWLQP